MVEEKLRFSDLRERHRGVTEAVGRAYAEAAGVCLDRHHVSPQPFHIVDAPNERRAFAHWAAPDERTKDAWANRDDATEAGAYGLALATVELARGLVAVRRAETLTGSDYYLGTPGEAAHSLKTLFRLEVSGVDSGDEARLAARLNQKIRQADRGNSKLPAIALVIGFRALKALAADVEKL